ncbi:MAG TPA: Gfo/Idh/MocA family oxidoreductase [Verrucomicrobiae bacterium]|jgi:predicted dehydrogenase|nr:Gfo/Idh/MocA family oxidoreductase [Verrucomicrobiae bacterium]
MNKNENSSDFDRRDFIKNSSLAALMAMMGGTELKAQTSAPSTGGTVYTEIPVGPTVKFGVIGLGEWGREILKTLALLPNAPVVALCDTYHASLQRSAKEAPKAEKFEDYQKLLASKDVEAVVIATPTHLHKQIVLDALAAGKHVYCEAPLATTVADAKAIAAAAKAAVKVVFQPGLQERSHPQRGFLVPFIRGGAMGQNIMARAQWHKKGSWRRSSTNAEHEEELNYRIGKNGLGLAGELGVHQFDVTSWFLKSRPTAVTGFGSIMLWKDGRTAPDTVQAVFEYPEGVRTMYDASLCASFENAYEVYYGVDSTIMVRDEKAWLFKEVDAALLGWEVYARKDQFYTETGIALVANATKQSAIGQSATSNAFAYQPIYYALASFTNNVGIVAREVSSYTENYGDDLSGLPETLSHLKLQPAASWREGLDATVVAIKANEAILAQQKVAIDSQLFDL